MKLKACLLATETQILRHAASYPRAVAHKDFVWIPAEYKHPILLVAHVDTVRRNPLKKKELCYTRGVYRTKNKTVLGADDRAGVYAVFEILRRCDELGLPHPHVLLTDGEERGGTGVGAFIKLGFFSEVEPEVRLMIELDRAGADEAVTYCGELPASVETYIESWGWSTGIGSFTDIARLITAYSVPGVNLSVGYYNQHTGDEYLVEAHLNNTIGRVMEMLEDPPVEKALQVDEYDLWSFAGSSTTTWKNMENLDAIVDGIYYCPNCEDVWHGCRCGTVAAHLQQNLTEDMIRFVIDPENGYFHDTDPPVKLLKGAI